MPVEPTEERELEAPPKDETEKLQYHTEEDLIPLRFHATRVPERLSASNPSLSINHVSNLNSFRKSLSADFSKPRSRSVSPSLRAETDANSSISSLETDSDILTDRMGLEELDIEKHRNLDVSSSSLPPVNERLTKDTMEDIHAFSDITKTTGSVSSSSLPPVNERLSKDTLEDVHAFSDVTKTSGSVSSRANSITTGGDVGSLLLETLDECEEFEEDHEEGAVHISNLDEIREEISEDLPPLCLNARHMSHLNACNVPDKVSTSHSSSVSASPEPRKTRHLRSSSGNVGSNQNRGETSSTNSSVTDVDIDILTDRMGLEELDLEKQRLISSDLGAAVSNLPLVTERLSNGTLEDKHAFTDVKSSASSVSRANSIVGDIACLETLNEVTEECEELDLHIISNMENIAKED